MRSTDDADAKHELFRVWRSLHGLESGWPCSQELAVPLEPPILCNWCLCHSLYVLP